jgi:hypothetical protein
MALFDEPGWLILWCPVLHGHWDGYRNGSAFTGFAFDIQFSTQPFSLFAHGRQPKTACGLGNGEYFELNAFAVIPYIQCDQRIQVSECQRNLVCLCMFADVV